MFFNRKKLAYIFFRTKLAFSMNSEKKNLFNNFIDVISSIDVWLFQNVSKRRKATLVILVMIHFDNFGNKNPF